MLTGMSWQVADARCTNDVVLSDWPALDRARPIDALSCRPTSQTTMYMYQCSTRAVEPSLCIGPQNSMPTHGCTVRVLRIWQTRRHAWQASAKRETSLGSDRLGRSPQRDPAVEPLVQGQALQLKHFYLLDVQWMQQICSFFLKLQIFVIIAPCPLNTPLSQGVDRLQKLKPFCKLIH